ncbi:MAG: MoaD/ThiS family protein [Pirellulaceae bacterium]|jgi:molybdopterin converting factor small subunit|nr:MoaD/ThiS family protein [Pirellulaceae bacterium]
MVIRVEFFGIARRRTQTATALVPAEGPVALGTLLSQLGQQFPEWAAECLDGDRLRHGYIANVDGRRFVSDPHELIDDNAALLVMSADAGG